MTTIKNKVPHSLRLYILLLFAVSTHYSCKKFVEVEAPPTSTSASIVYSTDADAVAVLTSIYIQLSQTEITNKSSLMSIPLFAGLSADELKPNPDLTDQGYIAHYENDLSVGNNSLPNYWQAAYAAIYTANAAIDGLTKSASLTPTVRDELIGEAKFVRAFCYFYLVNLYGDVPLNLTTDYKANATRSRTPESAVYDQIAIDLKEAANLLSADYRNSNLATIDERVRPNKFAAISLLSRCYLYKRDYVNAEIEATRVIDNDVYQLVSPDNVFLKDSKEIIWALQPVRQSEITNTSDAVVFIPGVVIDAFYFPVHLSENLYTKFSDDDRRKGDWIDSINIGGVFYYYSKKYKNNVLGSSVTEYPVILRLAEQYLVRAEARAKLGKLTGLNSAEEDLNMIRTRAGLTATTETSNEKDILNAILNERQKEFFLEWGHRWLDLKRTSTANEVLGAIKGTNWKTTDQLYLIPQTEIDNNPSLRNKQNPQ